NTAAASTRAHTIQSATGARTACAWRVADSASDMDGLLEAHPRLGTWTQVGRMDGRRAAPPSQPSTPGRLGRAGGQATSHPDVMRAGSRAAPIGATLPGPRGEASASLVASRPRGTTDARDRTHHHGAHPQGVARA